MKKCLLILALLIFTLPLTAAPDNQGSYVGTPPGFYDDIDPESIENKEDNVPKQNNSSGTPTFNNQGEFQTYSEDKAEPIVTETVKPTKNYSEIYNNLEPANFSYLHNIDPDQYYDMKDTAWSVYPLLRLNSPIYFKNQSIEPGYYLLTPRENKGKWYMLFKQNGQVVHIIPVYDRDYTPEGFYDKHIPKPKLKASQKVHMKTLEIIGKAKSSKRKDPIKSFLEVTDLDNYFISIVIYYGGHKYSTIFRTIRL